MSQTVRSTREDYVVWRQVTTRWADVDIYGHINNARYFELIDTAVNAYLAEATRVDIRRLPAIGVVVEVSCRYFSEMDFPFPVDIGLVVEKVGNTSVVYRVGLFQGETSQASAEGRFVHVYVGQTPGSADDQAGSRRPVPVPDEIRAVVQPLVRT